MAVRQIHGYRSDSPPSTEEAVRLLPSHRYSERSDDGSSLEAITHGFYSC